MIIVGLYIMMAAIQPMWAIEEYAIIFRSRVWLSPPQPPTITDMMAIVRSRLGLMVGEIWYRIDSGAIFCHVSRIRPEDMEIPCVTSGTQKWNGASPSFIAKAVVIMIDAMGLRSFDTVHCPECSRLMMIPIIRSIEAVACVRKYFVAASMARGLYFFMRMGIMANRFISKPIQTISQWEAVITIIVPAITVDIMIIKIGGLISMGRV